jgi:Fe-S cluster biogenesis protein NfuA
MAETLQNVIISKTSDNLWTAHHISSGKRLQGSSKDHVEALMRQELGLDELGRAIEPPTSPLFSGLAEVIAKFLEGPVTDNLSFHSGFARLESFENHIASIRLGGGCKGCPSSQITLFHGVKSQLQGRFGDDVIVDVTLAVNTTL